MGVTGAGYTRVLQYDAYFYFCNNTVFLNYRWSVQTKCKSQYKTDFKEFRGIIC